MTKWIFLFLLVLFALPARAQSYSNSFTGSTTGCPSAGQSCVTAFVATNSTTASFSLSGTFSATVQFEATNDGLNWTALSVSPSAGGSAVTSATSAGLWTATITAYSQIRMRCSTWVSGAAVATIIISGSSTSGGSPTGAAGGALSGTYPNPTAGTPIAPNQNVIYVSPNCGTQTNCVTVKDDGQVLWNQCTYSNGSATITCPTNTFTSADTGKYGFATSLLQTGYTSYWSAVKTCGGTITFVDSAHVTLSSNCTANSVANTPFFWGSDDTTALASAWTAVGKTCGTLSLPNGLMAISSSVFASAPSACTNPSGATSGARGIAIIGTGNSTLVPLPSFNFATCTGPDGSGTACFGWKGAASGAGGMTLRNWSVNGFGQGTLTGNPTFNVLDPPSDSIIENWSCNGWGAADANAIGVAFGLSLNAVLINTVFDGCAAIPVDLSGSGTIQIFGGFFGDSTNSTLYASGGTALLLSTNVLWGPMQKNSQSEIYCLAGAWNSYEDYVYGPSGTNTAELKFAGCTPVVISGMQTASITGSGNTVLTQSAGKVTLSNSVFTATSSAVAINQSAGTLIDSCGNTITSSGANVISGNLFGSCSITGTACTTGNWALTSGWGTSSVASVGANGDSHRCHVTITGAVGSAGPVLTWTFPTPYIVAPASCQLTGTYASLTGINEAAPSTTSVAFTFVGTPAAVTYNFDVSCGP